MTQEEKTYNRLISGIKNNPPVLNRPEELTADIMQSISRLRKRKRGGKLLYVTGWISTIAASLLICLLLGETFLPVNTKTDNVVNSQSGTQATALISIPELNPDMDITEKSEALFSLRKEKRENRMKRNTFLNINIHFKK